LLVDINQLFEYKTFYYIKKEVSPFLK